MFVRKLENRFYGKTKPKAKTDIVTP